MDNVEKIFKDKHVVELAKAISDNNVQTITKLVNEGVNPNSLSIKGSVTEEKIDLLKWAIYTQSKKGFSALLNAGADPLFSQNNAGQTLLHFTAMINDPYYLDILLKHGVDPNLKNTLFGNTALFDAIDNPNQFQLLLEAGADVDAINSGGQTVLFKSHPELVIQLLKLGADATVIDENNHTFQKYFFMTPETFMSKEGKENRLWVRDWLNERNIPIEN